jgi:hypothetical protein
MSELASSRPDSHQDSSPDDADRNDRRTVPVDETGKENWAENTSPVTRSQYGDQVRRELAARKHDQSADSDGDNSDLRSAAGHDVPEKRPDEPHARQDTTVKLSSAADRRVPATSDAPDHRADREPAQGREEASPDWPSAEERAQLHETYLDWRKDIDAGRERGTDIVGDKPDRSPDDRSDLPPTGEELLDMDSDSMSRFERLRHEVYKEADDIQDVAEKTGNRALELFSRPPTETYMAVAGDHAEMSAPALPGVEGGQVVVAGLMIGMLGYELFRGVKNRVRAGKEDGHGGH